MIIGICGKKFHGKSTIAKYFVDRGFIELTFAESLKKICKEIFNLSDEQLYGNLKEEIDIYWNMTPRQILQKVGTDLFRVHFDNDIWVKSIDKKIQLYKDTHNIVISDVRFLNEYNLIKSYDGIIINVVRDINTQDMHISENSLSDIVFDYNIDNNGSIDDLYIKLKMIIIN